ncbi:MAG: M16 family metallopeptidase [Pyrinomonadaceae bacterium]
MGPTPASVDAITRDKLQSFHKQNFVPNSAVFVVVGDVNREELMKRVENLFGNWSKGQPLAQNFPAPPARSSRVVYLVDRPKSAQSNIIIANLGLTRASADYIPAVVMNTVLGQNASSRLFLNLREKRSLTYGAYSSLDARRNAGAFRASSEVRTPVTGEALKEFFYELDRIRTEPVSEKEIRDAKSYLTGVFPIQLETQEGLINQLVQIKMFDLPANNLETYRERINAVTSADITRVARQYITPDRVAIIIVGDADQIRDQIKPYAQTLELYDTQGQRKEMSAAANGGGTAATQAATPSTNGQANAATNGKAADLVGSWTLQITTPNGQTVPATLIINQSGDALSGSVKSPLGGDIALSDLKLNSNGFDAALSIDMQGRKIDAKLTGNAADNRMTGSVNLDIPNAPALPFTGTRAQINP